MRGAAQLALVVLLVACGGQGSGDGERTPGGGEVADRAPPHVVLWLVDTLRADHLGCYGYERDTSPVLDRLAAEGVLFEELHVHSNWTQPSVTSLLSGCYPPTFSADFTDAVPDGLTMAAEWFGGHGYQTAGMTVTAATAALYGFDAGFETYRELDDELDMQARKFREGPAFDAARLVEAAEQWLDGTWDRARPAFLLLHSVDPHAPFDSHPELPSFTEPYDGPLDGSVATIDAALKERWPLDAVDKQHLVDLYDDEIRYSDGQLGALMDVLEERDLADDTLVVIVSDHGEEFWDRRTQGHGHRNLHAELTHVPWVMRWPGGLEPGVRVPGLSRGIDLLPTLVELAGLPPLPDADGTSRAAAIRAGQGPARGAEVLFADRAKEPLDVGAVRTPQVLFHFDPDGRTAGLYDLDRDPRSLTSVAETRRDEALDLRDRLVGWRSVRAQRSEAWRDDRERIEMDPEQRAALEALGYLGDG